MKSTKSVKSESFSHTTLVEEQMYNNKQLPKISVSESIDLTFDSIDEANEDVAMAIQQVGLISTLSNLYNNLVKFCSLI